MTFQRIFKSAPILGLAILLMAVGASASTITYNTSAAGTGFGGTSLILNSSAGAAATLTYIPQADATVGLPSNISLGNFTLACPTCTNQSPQPAIGSFFNAFTFNLIVTDITNGATGQFVGTSTGGAVYNDLSGITINWAPLELGPGTNNALSGDFDVTIFSTTEFTGVPSPNTGGTTGLGQVTVQGFVESSDVPEPATLSLVGGALLGLGLLRRKLLKS